MWIISFHSTEERRARERSTPSTTYGHDGVLNKSLGSHQLVIRGVVNNVKNTSLARHCLGSPGEVTVVQTHGPELEITTSASNHVDSLGSNLGVSRWTCHKKFTLLSDRSSLTTCVATLMHGVSGNSHRVTFFCDFNWKHPGQVFSG